MISYSDLYPLLKNTPLAHWEASLPRLITTALRPANNKDLIRWQKILRELPMVQALYVDFSSAAVTIGSENTSSISGRQAIEDPLRALHPWRKGPYRIHGVYIDAEWRSDFKWERLADFVAPLEGRLVLDVGCGNGYYGWRMLGAGAKLVIGIDPYLKNVMQFWAVRHFAGNHPFFVLPLGVEDLPQAQEAFDTVFSMGLLYHRRSPLAHLAHLHGLLRPGGEMVLETLVVEGDARQVLCPEGRYAKMRNVWFIPSPAALKIWLKRSGFSDIRLIDVSKTTAQEQRRTAWMTYESLGDFLAPNDQTRTLEGYPAPQRALFIARK